jgi:hypothetical protein
LQIPQTWNKNCPTLSDIQQKNFTGYEYLLVDRKQENAFAIASFMHPAMTLHSQDADFFVDVEAGQIEGVGQWVHYRLSFDFMERMYTILTTPLPPKPLIPLQISYTPANPSTLPALDGSSTTTSSSSSQNNNTSSIIAVNLATAANLDPDVVEIGVKAGPQKSLPEVIPILFLFLFIMFSGFLSTGL